MFNPKCEGCVECHTPAINMTKVVFINKAYAVVLILKASFSEVRLAKVNQMQKFPNFDIDSKTTNHNSPQIC